MNNPNLLEKKSFIKKISIVIKLVLVGLILFYYKEQFLAQDTKEKSRISQDADKTNVSLMQEEKKVVGTENPPEPMLPETKKEETPAIPEPIKTDVPEPPKMPEIETKVKPAEEILPLTLALQEDIQGQKKIVLEYHNDWEEKVEKLSVLLKLPEKWKIFSEDFKKRKPGYICDFVDVEPQTSQKKYLLLQPLEPGKYIIEIHPNQIKCNEATVDAKIKEKLPIKLEISF